MSDVKRKIQSAKERLVVAQRDVDDRRARVAIAERDVKAGVKGAEVRLLKQRGRLQVSLEKLAKVTQALKQDERRQANIMKRAQEGYERDKSREAERERERQDMLDAIEMIEGRDTEGAARARARINARLEQREEFLAKTADPEPAAMSDKELRRLERDRMKAAGIKRQAIRHEDGSQPTVLMKGRYHLRYFSDPEIAVLDRVHKLWESRFRGMGSRALEPKVDGGGAQGSVHQSRLESEGMLRAIVMELGTGDFAEIIGIAAFGQMPDWFEDVGSPRRTRLLRELKRNIRRIANVLDNKARKIAGDVRRRIKLVGEFEAKADRVRRKA